MRNNFYCVYNETVYGKNDWWGCVLVWACCHACARVFSSVVGEIWNVDLHRRERPQSASRWDRPTAALLNWMEMRPDLLRTWSSRYRSLLSTAAKASLSYSRKIMVCILTISSKGVAQSFIYPNLTLVIMSSHVQILRLTGLPRQTQSYTEMAKYRIVSNFHSL